MIDDLKDAVVDAARAVVREYAGKLKNVVDPRKKRALEVLTLTVNAQRHQQQTAAERMVTR